MWPSPLVIFEPMNGIKWLAKPLHQGRQTSQAVKACDEYFKPGAQKVLPDVR